MEPEIFIASILQSMQDSARQVRSSLGRPSSQATRQEALQQEQWARTARLWVDNSDQLLTETFGPMIAQGAEAKKIVSQIERYSLLISLQV